MDVSQSSQKDASKKKKREEDVRKDLSLRTTEEVFEIAVEHELKCRDLILAIDHMNTLFLKNFKQLRVLMRAIARNVGSDCKVLFDKKIIIGDNVYQLNAAGEPELVTDLTPMSVEHLCYPQQDVTFLTDARASDMDVQSRTGITAATQHFSAASESRALEKTDAKVDGDKSAGDVPMAEISKEDSSVSSAATEVEEVAANVSGDTSLPHDVADVKQVAEEREEEEEKEGGGDEKDEEEDAGAAESSGSSGLNLETILASHSTQDSSDSVQLPDFSQAQDGMRMAAAALCAAEDAVVDDPSRVRQLTQTTSTQTQTRALKLETERSEIVGIDWVPTQLTEHMEDGITIVAEPKSLVIDELGEELSEELSVEIDAAMNGAMDDAKKDATVEKQFVERCVGTEEMDLSSLSDAELETDDVVLAAAVPNPRRIRPAKRSLTISAATDDNVESEPFLRPLPVKAPFHLQLDEDINPFSVKSQPLALDLMSTREFVLSEDMPHTAAHIESSSVLVAPPTIRKEKGDAIDGANVVDKGANSNSDTETDVDLDNCTTASVSRASSAQLSIGSFVEMANIISQKSPVRCGPFPMAPILQKSQSLSPLTIKSCVSEDTARRLLSLPSSSLQPLVLPHLSFGRQQAAVEEKDSECKTQPLVLSEMADASMTDATMAEAIEKSPRRRRPSKLNLRRAMDGSDEMEDGMDDAIVVSSVKSPGTPQPSISRSGRKRRPALDALLARKPHSTLSALRSKDTTMPSPIVLQTGSGLRMRKTQSMTMETPMAGVSQSAVLHATDEKRTAEMRRVTFETGSRQRLFSSTTSSSSSFSMSSTSIMRQNALRRRKRRSSHSVAGKTISEDRAEEYTAETSLLRTASRVDDNSQTDTEVEEEHDETSSMYSEMKTYYQVLRPEIGIVANFIKPLASSLERTTCDIWPKKSLMRPKMVVFEGKRNATVYMQERVGQTTSSMFRKKTLTTRHSAVKKLHNGEELLALLKDSGLMAKDLTHPCNFTFPGIVFVFAARCPPAINNNAIGASDVCDDENMDDSIIVSAVAGCDEDEDGDEGDSDGNSEESGGDSLVWRIAVGQSTSSMYDALMKMLRTTRQLLKETKRQFEFESVEENMSALDAVCDAFEKTKYAGIHQLVIANLWLNFGHKWRDHCAFFAMQHASGDVELDKVMQKYTDVVRAIDGKRLISAPSQK